jgi:Tfp pilus assembly protein PilN
VIKVNLIGESRKKSNGSAARFTIAMPKSAMPLVLGLVVAGSALGGYLWYSSLSGSLAELDSQIASAQAQKAALDAVIKQDQVYETRKKTLETRIKVVEGLKRNQVNPVLAMDVLSEAIDRTQYVWLSNLDQNNATLSMSGTGTSLNAIADFVANLERSGYFRNPDLANATDSAGNFVFSLKCEFAPPGTQGAVATGGGN